MANKFDYSFVLFIIDYCLGWNDWHRSIHNSIPSPSPLSPLLCVLRLFLLFNAYRNWLLMLSSSSSCRHPFLSSAHCSLACPCWLCSLFLFFIITCMDVQLQCNFYWTFACHAATEQDHKKNGEKKQGVCGSNLGALISALTNHRGESTLSSLSWLIIRTQQRWTSHYRYLHHHLQINSIPSSFPSVDRFDCPLVVCELMEWLSPLSLPIGPQGVTSISYRSRSRNHQIGFDWKCLSKR